MVKEVPQTPPLPGEPARQALTGAVRQFFDGATSHDAPVLLVLEDLHWADEGSLALLPALARQARRLRLLIQGTYRDLPPDLQHPLEQTLAMLNRERLADRLPLRRLPEAGVGEMVAALLPDAFPPAGFIPALSRETEGNPLFVEEVVQHLVEEGTIHWQDGRWQIQPLEAFSVPPSIKLAIGRRLERLGEESREALTLAAVIGQQFSFELLLQASGLEEDGLLGMLDEWLDAHLVTEERDRAAHPQAGTRAVGGYPRERYRFQHALIREVLYNAPSLRRKARLHERVGLALEAVSVGALQEPLEELAYHFAQAQSRAATEKGVDYCLRAGEKARSLYANEEAIRHLTAALEMLDGLPEDEPHLRQRYHVVWDLFGAHRGCRTYEQGLEAAQEYLARAEQAGYPWCIAAAHSVVFWALIWSHVADGTGGSESSNRMEDEHLEKILQIANEHRLTDWQARARIWLAGNHIDVEYRYDPARAEALYRELLQDLEAVPRGDVQKAYGWLTFVCALQGKWDAAAAALRESIAFGEPEAPTGVREGMLAFLGPMETGMIRTGKQAEFVAFCEEARALYTQAGVPLALNQWYLEPTTPSEEFRQLLFRDDFDGPELRPEWRWVNPAEANSHSLSERPGFLTLRPERQVDNPRVFVEVQGDFALEAKLTGDWDKRLSAWRQSGLFVWCDVLNSVQLCKYAQGSLLRGDIRLGARVAGAHNCFGRGQIQGDSYYVRLERTGDRFAALCGTDGVHWLTCGHVILPVKGPVRAGVSTSFGLVVHYDYVQLLGRGEERRFDE